MQISKSNHAYSDQKLKTDAAINAKQLIKSTVNTIRKQAKDKYQHRNIDITSFVGNDLLICAGRRHNILTEDIYAKEGRYTLTDVQSCFGSFAKACTQLKIINPDNIEDKMMIIKNLKDVFEYARKIDKAVYQEYGAYSYTAIDKRWGFSKLLIEAGLATPVILYPIYLIKQMPRHTRLTWSYTRNKKFYGV